MLRQVLVCEIRDSNERTSVPGVTIASIELKYLILNYSIQNLSKLAISIIKFRNCNSRRLEIKLVVYLFKTPSLTDCIHNRENFALHNP